MAAPSAVRGQAAPLVASAAEPPVEQGPPPPRALPTSESSGHGSVRTRLCAVFVTGGRGSPWASSVHRLCGTRSFMYLLQGDGSTPKPGPMCPKGSLALPRCTPGRYLSRPSLQLATLIC